MNRKEYLGSDRCKATQYIEKSPFLADVPTAILVSLRRSGKGCYVGEIARKVDTTYAHTVKTLQMLEEDGYVKSEKKGRKRICELTAKGEKEADVYAKAVDLIKSELAAAA